MEIQRLQPNITAMPNDKPKVQPSGNTDLWEPVLRVSFRISNTESLPGAAVPQLYVAFPQDTTPSGTPEQVTYGFSKPSMQPQKSQKVTFELLRRDVSYSDSVQQTLSSLTGHSRSALASTPGTWRQRLLSRSDQIENS